MPIYSVLVPVKGGKALKFEKGEMPVKFPSIGSLKMPEGAEVIPVEHPFVLTDELHAKLNVTKQYSTYLLCRVIVKDGEEPGTKAFAAVLENYLEYANYAEAVESTYNYQILKVGHYMID